MSAPHIGSTATLPAAADVAEGIVERYWKLYVHPFRQSPDPAFVYESGPFREALARILYDIVEVGGGLSVLTGSPGLGVTTLLRTVESTLPESFFCTAHVVETGRPVAALLSTVLSELGMRKLPRGRSALFDAATSFFAGLAREGREAVVLVDEAHVLGASQLEGLRRLMNIETNERKLLHLVLAGQPKLSASIARNESLTRRVTMRASLEPLQSADADRYIAHRLRMAGAERDPFSPRAASRIVARCKGNPRRINVVATAALLAGALARATTISPAMVDAAAREVEEATA